MQNYFCRQHGQTLIESLMTIVFIGMAIIALIRFQTYLAYDNSLAQQRGDATLLAASRLENLRDFQVLNTTSGYTAYQSIASGTTTSTGTTATYTITWTVTTNTNPNYKTLAVVVSWTDRNNVSQSVELDSIVAGIDPANSSEIIG